jgi:tRNA dimethylallyltransferase
MRSPFENALVLTGPTGSGKSALALEVAERLGAEIVAMDSMTLYRGMDVGTAKPTQEERRRVPHHLIDVLDPWESASVAWWLDRAAECCRAIEQRGRRILFVGGTALYLKALLFGLFDGPPADKALRDRLTAEAEENGALVLHERLQRVDPASAQRLHPNDLRRVIRALEVWELTGRPLSDWQQQWKRDESTDGEQGKPRSQALPGNARVGGSASRTEAELPHEILSGRQSLQDLRSQAEPGNEERVLCLDVPRAELFSRINARVEAMITAGLVDEVRALRQLPRPLSREAAQALGYKEMIEHLEGRTSLAETVERIQTRSRQFAKRQLTWFRHLPECRPASRQLTFALWRV